MRAVISIGTNTTRLLVASESGAALVPALHDSIGTRLGEGLRDRGTLRGEPMRRTLEAVSRFYQRARTETGDIAVIATSAVRRAQNAREFIAALSEAAQREPHILSGEEEARCSFIGATAGYDGGHWLAVLDPGGGSTECATGTAGKLDAAVSCEIGSVRVTERFPELSGTRGVGGALASAVAEAREVIRQALAPLQAMRGVERVFAVAGTPLTLGAIAFERDVESIDGETMPRAQIAELLARLLDATLEERRGMPGMVPQRADVMPAGALILDEALAALDSDECRLTRNDLLLGYLISGNSAPHR